MAPIVSDEIDALVLNARRAAPDLDLDQLVSFLRPTTGKKLTVAKAREILKENKSTTADAAPGVFFRARPAESAAPPPHRHYERKQHERAPGKSATPAEMEEKKRLLETIPKRAAWKQMVLMMETAMDLGNSYRGWYPLLPDVRVEDATYSYTAMFWVDCNFDGSTFERMKLEATVGLPGAVWYLWNVFKQAVVRGRGTKHVSPAAIARQLEREYGFDPREVAKTINDVDTPAGLEWAKLLISISR
ncbi:hypothetical protein RQP46_007621 [Phenoliferia psychrophenolica]